MAKARRLKVFRTAIGFHDAYVAAPSRKAALEAWGTGTNLFAAGAAEEVTEPTLMAAALERPGAVVKVLRGSEAEQMRALGDAPGKPDRRAAANARERPSPRPSPARKRGRRPSRAGVESAEAALERAEARHREALAGIRAQQEALEQRQRDLDARHRKEREQLEQRIETARREYSQRMAGWAAD